MANTIIPYKRYLKARAQELRKNATLTEQLIWEEIRKKSLNVEFHRQVHLLDYIVNFIVTKLDL